MAGERLTAYQWKLFGFLGVATFFEGYDFMIIANVLPNLRADLGLSEATAGVMVGVANIGTVVAYWLVRRADRWGRKSTLSITIAGYTIFTFLTGFAVDAITFTMAQFFARMFLIAELAITMVYAAEEYPADRRGTVIGVLQALASLGAVVCAGVMPLLLKLPWGWRSAYFVAALPLLLLAYARRGLRESQRFVDLKAEEARSGQARPKVSVWRIFRTPYRRRMLQMALIWALSYACGQTTVVFWKDFAINERGFTDAMVAGAITTAALAAMPLVFAVGRLLDVLGRRMGAAIIFTVGAAGTWLCYSLESVAGLTGALILGIFGVSAYLPVLNTYTTELFPTDLRADAFAWSNNLLGRIGYVGSPAIVGAVAATYGWGPSVRVTALGPIAALILILVLLPETRNMELEQSAAL